MIIRYSLNAPSGAVPEMWNVKQTSGLLHAGPAPSRQEQQEMIAAIDANDIQPIIDSTFPLDQIEAAFRHQISQRHFGEDLPCIVISDIRQKIRPPRGRSVT